MCTCPSQTPRLSLHSRQPLAHSPSPAAIILSMVSWFIFFLSHHPLCHCTVGPRKRQEVSVHCCVCRFKNTAWPGEGPQYMFSDSLNSLMSKPCLAGMQGSASSCPSSSREAAPSYSLGDPISCHLCLTGPQVPGPWLSPPSTPVPAAHSSSAPT